jgi:hypothetical protein
VVGTVMLAGALFLYQCSHTPPPARSAGVDPTTSR